MVIVAKNGSQRGWYKGLMLGLGIASLGIISLAIPPIARLEPDVGLKWLFNLRGSRPAPEEVVVITIDRDSSRHLGLPNVPRKWPRILHADLVRKLKSAGASVICFDMIFTDQRKPEHDREFAGAMQEAGNVILFEYVQSEKIEYPGNGQHTAVHMEKRLPPIAEFATSALAVAPFHLPKVPERVNQAWLFKSGAGDLPTIPVVAMHQHLSAHYPELQRHIQSTIDPGLLPDWLKADKAPSTPDDYAFKLHQFFLKHPDILRQIYLDTRGSTIGPLIYTHLHGQEAGIFLDFYGPARSLTTIPYHLALENMDAFDLEHKAVFVGFSERLQPEQKDGFFTAFTDNEGLDVSGVEIMATTFANLLEERHIQPMRPPFNIFLVALFGLLIGIFLYRLHGIKAVLLACAVTAAYLLLSYWQFDNHARWIPLVIPLLIQLPVALVLALLFHYLLSHREKKRLHYAFTQYVPEHIANAAAVSGFAGSSNLETEFGVCLATDASDFTTRSEILAPRKLHHRLNEYFEELFAPVKHHNGLIIDVVGDAMLSAWLKDDAIRLRESACRAAIEIQKRLKQYPNTFPTRIGLHCGEISVGNVGAGDHYEYRIVGDVVNTATRIEGLNKYLKTGILASEETLQGLNKLPSRKLGQFRLKGKQQALTIHELFSAPPPDDLCLCFAKALESFSERQWQLASQHFKACLIKYPEDGPSQFYLSMTEQFLHAPPDDDWDGVVNISQK